MLSAGRPRPRSGAATLVPRRDRTPDTTQANNAAPLSVNFTLGAALMPPEPAAGDGGAVDAGAKVVCGASRREELRIDALNIYAAVLHHLERGQAATPNCT